MLTYQTRLRLKDGTLTGSKYTTCSNIKLVNKIENRFDVMSIEEYFNESGMIPEYMHMIPTKIVFIGSNWQIRKMRIKGYIKFLAQFIKTRNLYKCLDEEVYTLPYVDDDEVMAITMREKDSKDRNIVYIYLDKLYESCDDDVEFETSLIIAILHELYHVYQKQYWKRFKEFDSYYCTSNPNTIKTKAYFMNELEVSARAWSLDRVNYITGSKLKYVIETKNENEI